jgi:hypothetical protein
LITTRQQRVRHLGLVASPIGERNGAKKSAMNSAMNTALDQTKRRRFGARRLCEKTPQFIKLLQGCHNWADDGLADAGASR